MDGGVGYVHGEKKKLQEKFKITVMLRESGSRRGSGKGTCTTFHALPRSSYAVFNSLSPVQIRYRRSKTHGKQKKKPQLQMGRLVERWVDTQWRGGST
jgi:hypothetical protein